MSAPPSGCCQTSASSSRRDITCPERRARYASRSNSRGVSSSGAPASVTSRAAASSTSSADPDRRLLVLVRAQPAQHGFDPRVQLGRPERLDDVVVGAVPEGRDHVRLVVPRGRDDHRDIADGAQHPQDLGAVHVRQPQIQDDEIGAVGDGGVESRHAGRRGGDGVATVAQRAHQRTAQLRIVLDDK